MAKNIGIHGKFRVGDDPATVIAMSEFYTRQEKWECHGCGKGIIKVVAIELPNLCNQALYLCEKCEKKMLKTLHNRSIGLTAEMMQIFVTDVKNAEG